MKSEIFRLLAIAIILGTAGCDKPDSVADWTKTEQEPEIASAEIAPAADESVATEIADATTGSEVPVSVDEAAELSDRDKVLAVRAGYIGATRQDLAFNGIPLGEATIMSIDDSGVRLQHQAGVTNLSWADVPAPLKEAWGYDPIGSALFSSTNSSGSPKLSLIEAGSAALNTVDSKEPEPTAPSTAIALDPASQARVLALQSQIAKLSENLKNARETVKEAQVFHGELAVIYADQEKKEAAEKAARVYERMRASSCSS